MDVLAKWRRGHSAIFSWNECTLCGHREYDNIWGEQSKPKRCPGCYQEIEPEKKPEPFDYSKLPPVGRCRAHTCIQDRLDRDLCLTCGFNETEFQRRIHLPWSINDNGLLYKNISINTYRRNKE